MTLNGGKIMSIIHFAVIVVGLDEEYPYNIICGINNYAREHNINVSYFSAFGGVVDSRKFDIGEFSIYNLTNFSRFDGAIVLTNTFADDVLRDRVTDKVKESGIPAVVFESKDYPDFYDISIDNYSVMYELVEHVIKVHNAKVFNYVSGPLANPEGLTRYNAFCDALKNNGLEFDDRRFFHGNFRSFDGTQAVEAHKASGLPMPDAFICANDSMALTVMSSLEKMHVKVPDDVIVTGFDNTFNAQNSCPTLTTVNRPLYTSGVKACEVLMNVINNKPQEKSTVLSASPVFTESCGCPGCIEENMAEYKKNTYHRIEAMNNHVHMLNRLTAALAEAETADLAFKVIGKMLNELDCEKFSLCLIADWEDAFNTSSLIDENATYSDYMCAPIIWDNGVITDVELFSSSDMFPYECDSGGNINYFLPLHYGEKCLGYYIITNSDFPIYSLLSHTLCLNISNSLENITKVNHINKNMEELNRIYVIDPLCNIYNRNGFFNIVDDMFKDCVANNKKIMMSFIDMDMLKFINDNYGHNEGDFAIKCLSNVIRDCCAPTDICARFGGDEFVIFSSSIKGDAAELLNRKISKGLANINSLVRRPYTISASVGSVIKELSSGDSLYKIIEHADEKMYEIKKQKKMARASEKIN